MADADNAFEEEEIEAATPIEEVVAAKKLLAERCKEAGIALEEITVPYEEPRLRVGMKCGRNTRWLNLWTDDNSIMRLLSIPFEKYSYLSGLEAVCSYADGTIEAAIRPLAPVIGPSSYMLRRLFGFDPQNDQFDIESAKISVPATQEGLPHIEISPASEVFTRLARPPGRKRVTLKLTGCHVSTHDTALALLNKAAGSILFQLDLLTDFPVGLEKERRHFPGARKPRRQQNQATELQYPKIQFENAPLSLYWYGRSATGMPLLQFLAFYQAIEFYFPIYSQSEAQRKLKAILKDPTFRGDRDTDIARLLAAIHISRSGAFGDERSQLRATLMECSDSDELRRFMGEDAERKEFFLNKAKALPYHKIPLANTSVDLRNDVADRIYDIRCKIVHTKADSRDGDIELLLPFTPEAEQLSFDIELVQHLAQLVLVAGSTPFNVHS
ncbi:MULTISPECIES: hypothetical protein [Chromobacterium]|uniref:hypothetical protein n=1 Tax=Chromobacterium TaxID=535 RepID=UPI000AB1EC6B|nr:MULTISPECIES: hypothetical protein [Chromobacterium]